MNKQGGEMKKYTFRVEGVLEGDPKDAKELIGLEMVVWGDNVVDAQELAINEFYELLKDFYQDESAVWDLKTVKIEIGPDF